MIEKSTITAEKDGNNSLDIQLLDEIRSTKRVTLLPEKIKELLSLGAHVDGPSRDGMPLRFAIANFSCPIVQLLVYSGANVNANLGYKRITSNPLHWAAHRSNSKKMSEFECHFSLTNIVFLIAHGANHVAIDAEGSTPADYLDKKLPSSFRQVFELPLHAAIELNKPNLCIKLLNLNFDPQAKNKKKQTALSFAKSESPECFGVMQSWLANQAIEEMLIRVGAPSP